MDFLSRNEISYNKNFEELKLKFLLFKFFRILKCVTKRECVTSRVRKDARGYCN